MRDSGRWNAPRRRPPWWPENEAWPPAGRAGRGGGHRRMGFWRPVGCLVLAFAFFAAGMVAVASWAVAALVGLVSAPPIVVGAGVIALVLILAIVLTLGRTLRRMTQPVDELIAAAERVEAGDYSARVTETGPRPVRRLARAFNTMSTRLESSDQRRRTFLADVSHELRTPLTVIQGQLEAIADGIYPADAAHLESLMEQTRTLERLVEDLRTVALAEAGSLQLALVPTDPGALVEEIASAYQAAADGRQVRLTASGARGLPTVEVDPARMRQVLSNLVDNALRHTPSGGAITLSVSEPEGASVLIEITDTGTGIARELLPHVFDRFAKGAGSPGSGLGLAIAKDLVEAHGGSIVASSEPGTGATFRIRLPSHPPMPLRSDE